MIFMNIGIQSFEFKALYAKPLKKILIVKKAENGDANFGFLMSNEN